MIDQITKIIEEALGTRVGKVEALQAGFSGLKWLAEGARGQYLLKVFPKNRDIERIVALVDLIRLTEW